ncbi:MAG: cupin domain-containing protein [Gammaproteobacteria bacterium]
MQLIDNDTLEWMHLVGDESFDYPIDYAAAVLSARPDGHIDLLFRWAPNSYCHFHRHLVATTTTVLQGEHHLVDMHQGVAGEHRVRAAGDYSHKPPGEVHMEYAGPEGSLLLFNMYAPDGKLFEILDRDENVLMLATVEDFTSGRLASAA